MNILTQSKWLKIGLASVYAFAPVVASAQIVIGENGISGLESVLEQIYNIASPIAVTLIIIYLLYGAFLFATGGGDEERRGRGKDILLYGLVGLIIITSLLGIVNFVVNSISFESSADVPNPQDFE